MLCILYIYILYRIHTNALCTCIYHVILLFLELLLIHLLNFFIYENTNKYFVILENILLYGIELRTFGLLHYTEFSL